MKKYSDYLLTLLRIIVGWHFLYEVIANQNIPITRNHFRNIRERERLQFKQEIHFHIKTIRIWEFP